MCRSQKQNKIQNQKNSAYKINSNGTKTHYTHSNTTQNVLRTHTIHCILFRHLSHSNQTQSHVIYLFSIFSILFAMVTNRLRYLCTCHCYDCMSIRACVFAYFDERFSLWKWTNHHTIKQLFFFSFLFHKSSVKEVSTTK